MLKHSLNDSAAIRMRGKPMHLPRESVDDELNVLCWYSLDCFLDDMVAVLIFDTFEDVMFKLLDQLRLLVGQNMLEGLREIRKTSEQKGSVEKPPFEQPGNRTFEAIEPECGFSFDLLGPFSVPGYHAQRISGLHSCRIHLS